MTNRTERPEAEIEDIAVIRYKPSHRYILVVSGDAIEQDRSKMLIDFLDEMGAGNVAMIWVEPGVDPKSVVDLIDLPRPLHKIVLYWVSALWKKIHPPT